MRRWRPWIWGPAAAYGLIGGAWPLLGNGSFRALMGAKTDMWVMCAVSLQVGVVASVLVRADLNDRVTPEITGMVCCSSGAITALELGHLIRRRIPVTYFLDAAGHLGLIAMVVNGARREGHSPVEGAASMEVPDWIWRGQVGWMSVRCVWPLVGAESFQRVTGRKDDMWLAQALALLVGTFGLTIGRAGARGRITPEIAQLAVGSGISLAAVDLVNVARRRIPKVYLLDAAVHAALASGWIVARRQSQRHCSC